MYQRASIGDTIEQSIENIKEAIELIERLQYKIAAYVPKNMDFNLSIT